ncbi:hypothetical protein [Bradyrhizobium sp. URHD0069]|uniref:hypothetical protein n=1 Tax=Bradyrhizobium sp. URHD0069 TaxID=1380355 RepID=UPI0005646B2F|nr:hypothetical protein [Bradyrhizobium sp. URHD0069]
MKKGLLIFGIGVVGLLAVMMIVGWEDGGMIARAKAVVRANLRDPDSAQFQDIIVFRHGNKHTACGSVNSKNGFGGYVGYKPFIYREPSYGLIIAGKDFNDLDIEQACQQARLEGAAADTAMSGTKENAAKGSSCFGPEDCNPGYVSFGTAGK